MRRSLLPFILVSFGFTLILLSLNMPLFEWQISELATDFPSTYKVDVFPSPWVARFGNSFGDNSYVFTRVFVLKDRRICKHIDISLQIKRAPKDEVLERRWLNIYTKNISWLARWSLIEIVLSVLYIWWFVILYKRHSFWKALGLTILAIFIFLNLIPRLTGPLFPGFHPGEVDCYHGTITFNARLSKVHYETLIVFFAGIFLELGAIGVMVRQITKAVIQRRSPN